jgi:hypothetical protein
MEIAEHPEFRARRYRRTAAHLRSEAEAPHRWHERAELLAIADQYDRLADRFARSCVNAPAKDGCGVVI